VLKVCGQLGSKKLIKKSLRLTGEITTEKYEISEDFNFIGILMKDSDLMCLDIDPVTPSSIPNFYLLLNDLGINPNSLLIERSINDGLHVYFRLNGRKVEHVHFMEYKGIHFDVLTKFRVFTSPSEFGGKRYEWVGGGINTINSLEEIPEVPDFVFEMIGI
jgi:hypothetical protein